MYNLKHLTLENAYIFFVVMVFLDSLYFYYTWNLPNFLLPLFSIFIGFLLIEKNEFEKFSIEKILCFFLLGVLYLYSSIRNNGAGLYTYICSFVCLLIFSLQPYALKKKLFIILRKVFVIILLFSLIQWSLVCIFHFNFPYVDVNYGEQYKFHNYGLFLFTYYDGINLTFNRFHSMFLEPGHLGVLLVLVLSLDRFDLKRKENVILLISALFTLSLATYLLLVFAFIYKNISYKKLKYLLLGGFLIILLFLISKNNPDSIFYEKIFDRLVIKDGKINGNNRFTSKLSNYYNSIKDQKSFYIGIGTDKYQNLKFGSNAGYKVYIITYGLIGFIIAVISYLFAFLSNPKRDSLLFFLLWFFAILQASYPLWNCQLLLLILSLDVFKSKINDCTEDYCDIYT